MKGDRRQERCREFYRITRRVVLINTRGMKGHPLCPHSRGSALFVGGASPLLFLSLLRQVQESGRIVCVHVLVLYRGDINSSHASGGFYKGTRERTIIVSFSVCCAPSLSPKYTNCFSKKKYASDVFEI